MIPVQVREIMNRSLLSVRDSTLAADAERLARAQRRHHLLVSAPEDLIGVVCVCDLRAAPAGALAGECVRRPTIAIDGHMKIERAAEIMRERRIGCLPIVEGTLVTGLVTRDDLICAGISFDDDLGGKH